MSIYERIKLVVKLRKTTLKLLAEETGISYDTIKKWGQGTDASAVNLLAVARCLDVSMDYLVGNTTDPNSHKEAGELAVWTEVRDLAQKRLDEMQRKDD